MNRALDRASLEREIQEVEGMLEGIYNPAPENRIRYFDPCDKMRRDMRVIAEQCHQRKAQLESRLSELQ